MLFLSATSLRSVPALNGSAARSEDRQLHIHVVIFFRQLSEADATQVVRKQVKQRQDSIESFEKGGRAELAAKEKEELSILQSYLPQAMSADEVSKVVRETIADVGATSKAQMGAVMRALQTKVAGRADGKTLSAEVQKQLP